MAKITMKFCGNFKDLSLTFSAHNRRAGNGVVKCARTRQHLAECEGVGWGRGRGGRVGKSARGSGGAEGEGVGWGRVRQE